MRTVRSARGAVLLVAVLALATAWIAVDDRAPSRVRDAAPFAALERDPAGTLTSADLADLAPASVLTAHPTVEPRLGSLWALPGLAAALAAVCALRRLRASPAPPARRVLLRDSVSRRAPPLESFA